MGKDKNLTAFNRIWSYVWPQWPRLVSVVFWSLVIAVMFTVSFMTVLPLLKVMMGDEGLHGWVDRKTVEWRYGLELAVPDIDDYSSGEVSDSHALRIVGIKANSLADQSGFEKYDRIVSIDGSPAQELIYFDLLKKMAVAEATDDKETLSITFTRDSQLETDSIDLEIATQDLADGRRLLTRIDWGGKWMASNVSTWLVGFLPRNANKTQSVIFIIVGMSIVTLFRCIARFYQTYLAEKIVHTSVTNIREDVFVHTMHMPIGFFSSQGTSDTTSRILGDVTVCGKGIKVILSKMLREPLKAIGTLVGAMLISWQLTLIFIAAAPVTIGMFGILGRKIKKATKKSLLSNAEMLNRIQNAIGSLRVVKVYNRQDHEIKQYHETNRLLLKRLLRVAKIETITNPLMEVLGMLAGSGALIFGAVWMSQGRVDPEGFLTMLVMLGTSAESIRKVSGVWNHVQTANAAAERVFAIVDEPREPESPNAAALKSLQDSIRFDNVVFTYPGSNRAALKGIDLNVPAGQTVAVVGPNGSGKSTLVNLLPRFYEPDSGRILIDGQNIHDGTLASLRDQISMVTQSVVTFNDTIAHNIAYGKPDATRDEIVEAAKRAFAHEFIEILPERYDTVIGENSAGFSGGQLQRIVIARAILKNPRILIFDEAMSQIDADSEAKIHNALEDIMKGRTCFLIAHRFSTVISADRIVVIDDGRVVGEGTHNELMVCSDVYKRLYETQLLGTSR